jgi:hypothetical protein
VLGGLGDRFPQPNRCFPSKSPAACGGDLYEVVIALEFTAAVTAHAEIFKAARDARHAMDDSEPWKRS